MYSMYKKWFCPSATSETGRDVILNPSQLDAAESVPVIKIINLGWCI